MLIRGKDDGGYALVFVLWIVILLAVIGSSLIHAIRVDKSSVSLEMDDLSASLIADGGINRVIISLVDPSDERRWCLDGTRQDVSVEGGSASVRVTSEAGRVDLNAAPANILASILAAGGATPSDSIAIAARIIAWRSPRSFEAEDPAVEPYREAGRSYGPRHGPFRSVGELRMILGVTDQMEAAAAPQITIYTNSPNIDIAVAPDQLLRTLAGSGNQFAEAELDARLQGRSSVERYPQIGEPLLIEARAAYGKSTAYRVAIIRLTANSRQGYQVFSWR